jgi:hypothetical protein
MSAVSAWNEEEGEQKKIVYNDLDRFRIQIQETAFEEAEAMITPELCALRDCIGVCALEIAISGCAPFSMIQRIIGFAPELAREMSCFGFTPLHEVFRIGHVERDKIVPLLLSVFPEGISVKGLCSEIPIFTMVRRSPDLAMFRVLHAAAEAIGYDDLSARDVTGGTLLHLAVLTSMPITVAIVNIRRETRDAVNLRGLRPFHLFCFSDDAEFSENDALIIFHNVYNTWVPLAEKVGYSELYDCEFIQRALNNWSLHMAIKQWLVDEHPAWCECATPSFEEQLAQQRLVLEIGQGRL